MLCVRFICRPSRTRCALVSRPPQCALQFLFLQRPTLVLGLRFLVESITLLVQGRCTLVMLSHGFVQGGLRLGDSLLPAFTLLLLSRLFFGLLALATPPFPFIRLSRLPVRRLVRLDRRLLR